MNLPNYFLADLPEGASFSPSMITEACQTLRRNRDRYLAHRSTASLVHVLSNLASNWLDETYSFRRLALEQGPALTGFSQATLKNGLTSFFKGLTVEAFNTLLEQDLGHRERLDHFCAMESERKTSRLALATSPELLVHIAAGNVPNPTLLSMVLGLLVRSAQFVKCATGTSFLPRLFAHSLYEAEPKLGACLEIAEWRGGTAESEAMLYDNADCVTATGSDETLAAIRARLPAKTRLIGYGHKVSFGYISRDALTGLQARNLAKKAANDVAIWNQFGCLSPHLFYLQNGSVLSPEHFAEMVAEELEQIEIAEPRGDLPVSAAAGISSRRSLYEVRAAHSPETRLWCSKGSTAWTVVYEADPRFQPSCQNRFVYIKGVKDLTEALQNADAVRGKVSTVSLAALENSVQELAAELARWGVTRVCPLGQMQQPPLMWRHDGRAPLGELIIWTDWEK